MHRHPYDDTAESWIEEHNGIIFYLKNALKYVIDDYDEYLGSVELSHYERLNYNEVTDFNYRKIANNKIPDTLDLTWMKPKDIFKLDDSYQYRTITRVIANVDNLYGSCLSNSNEGKKVKVVINKGNSMKLLTKQIAYIIWFARSNGKEIKEIELAGYSPLEEKIILFAAKRKGIDSIIVPEKKTIVENNQKRL